MTSPLVFLKLGGSLITDKHLADTPRLEVLARLAGEIARALNAQPQFSLLVGHGSGSFGHSAALRHNTRAGAHTPEQWRGFAAALARGASAAEAARFGCAVAGISVTRAGTAPSMPGRAEVEALLAKTK